MLYVRIVGGAMELIGDPYTGGWNDGLFSARLMRLSDVISLVWNSV